MPVFLSFNCLFYYVVHCDCTRKSLHFSIKTRGIYIFMLNSEYKCIFSGCVFDSINYPRRDEHTCRGRDGSDTPNSIFFCLCKWLLKKVRRCWEQWSRQVWNNWRLQARVARLYRRRLEPCKRRENRNIQLSGYGIPGIQIIITSCSLETRVALRHQNNS